MFARIAQGLAAASIALGATAASAHDLVQGHGHIPHTHHRQQVIIAEPRVVTVTITVSCFRGPFREVIWDRPEAPFLQSLVDAGYTFPEASAIGERVCRDITTVGNNAAVQATMERIIRENPPGSINF